MDAHEAVWQVLFHLFHRQEGNDGLRLALYPYFQIFAHTLDVTDVGDIDLYNAVISLEEERIVGGKTTDHRTADRRCITLQPLPQTICCPLKILQSEGFQYIVDGIDAEALYGILGIGCGEDYKWRYGKRLYEVHAVEVGHIDVAEDGIYRIVFQKRPRLQSALALGRELKERHFTNIGNELLQSQWLIINSETTYLNKGMLRSTE